MPPSESTIFRSGYRSSALRCSRSAASVAMAIGMEVIQAEIGDKSELAVGAEPVC